jgi:AAA domain
MTTHQENGPAGGGAKWKKRGVEGNSNNASRNDEQGNSGGSWNIDDTGRPRWNRDTELIARYDYQREGRTYAYTISKGRNTDGSKVFKTERLSRVPLQDQFNDDDRDQPGLGTEKPVLYRLPELLDGIRRSTDKRVLILEGEKDVETARELDFVATCNPFGALKWLDTFSPYLADCDVIICPDNDARGAAHAADVARKIKRYAKRWRVIDLGGAKDLTEWVEARRQAGLQTPAIRAELSRLIEATPAREDKGKIIKTNVEFVSEFTAPDYAIDGLLMKGNLYGLTSPTNGGKTAVALLLTGHTVSGKALGDRDVVQGKVLFLSGENPDDVRIRWIKLCEELQLTEEQKANAYWIAGRFSLSEMYERVLAETAEHGPFAMVVIDSAASFYEGDDENQNTQIGRYAAVNLRAMTQVNGRPCVLVLCHPVKNFNIDCLQPRGGGAFVAELDSNLVLVPKSENPKVSELHWHVKHRGVDFAPLPFKITAGTSEQLKDAKGRFIWTVTAALMTQEQAAAADNVSAERQDQLLVAMKNSPRASLVALARACGWAYATGEPNKTLAHRTMHDLQARKLVKLEAGCWSLTRQGQTAAATAAGAAANAPF